MAKVKCEKCGREFKSEHALKIHQGLQHAPKRRTRKPARKASLLKRSAQGKYVCPICGRSFKLAMHLARHQSAAHGKRAKGKKAVRRATRERPRKTTPGGVPVNTLSVDELLALKNEVDARLATIVRQMRQAKIRI